MLAELTMISMSGPAGQQPRGLADLDLRQACEDAARGLADEATTRRVQVTLAFSGRLQVSGDAAALAPALRRLLAAAIEDNAGRAVLLTGSLRDGRVRVGILGDGPAPFPSALAGEAREAARTVAWHGGTLEDGTGRPNASVVLRLPPAAPRRDMAAGPEAAAGLQPAGADD